MEGHPFGAGEVTVDVANIPDEADILRLQHDAIDSFGGEHGVLKEGCVDGTLNGAITSAMYHGDDDDVDLLYLASFLLHKFAKNKHCFVDGNKRIGWIAAIDVLNRHHLTIEAGNEEAARMVEQVVDDSSCDVDWIATWLGKRLTALE